MDTAWIKFLSQSKDIALLLSMTFNAVAVAAIALMWRRSAGLEKRVTGLLSDTVKELCRFLDRTP